VRKKVRRRSKGGPREERTEFLLRLDGRLVADTVGVDLDVARLTLAVEGRTKLDLGELDRSATCDEGRVRTANGRGRRGNAPLISMSLSCSTTSASSLRSFSRFTAAFFKSLISL
jgi:hypothetical protein